MHNEDFSFLPKVSNTCKRGENEDFRILQKNRAKVTLNVLKGHGFTMDETNNIYIMHSNLERRLTSNLLDRG